MKSKFINVIMFAAGAAIGSAVTWKIVKTKYDQLVQEEIESVKKAFSSNFTESKDVDVEETADESEEDKAPAKTTTRQINWEELEDLDEEDDEVEGGSTLNDYAKLVEKYNNLKGGLKTMKNVSNDKPYVIEPMEFGELDDYSTFELTYYADGILEDEDYDIVRDVEDLLGPDALNSFGEYEDDAVFVRNDFLHADFQILKDYRTYDEARSVGPKVDN